MSSALRAKQLHRWWLLQGFQAIRARKLNAGVAEQLLQHVVLRMAFAAVLDEAFRVRDACPPAVVAALFRIRSRYSSHFMMTRNHSRCEAWQASIRVLVSITVEISTAQVSGSGRPKMSRPPRRSRNTDTEFARSALSARRNRSSAPARCRRRCAQGGRFPRGPPGSPSADG